MACSFAPSLLVLATLIALVLLQLGLRAAAMTRSKGQENFDASSSTHEYDVFVSFPLADIPTKFTTYLYAAFYHKRIRAYEDDIDLPRGIEPKMLKAIETSRIAIIVFSKTYVNSRQCLDELLKIMECKTLLNQTVLPIFYDVSSSELQNHEYLSEAILNGPEDKVNNWMAALNYVAYLAGWHLEPYGTETEFIEKIVESVWTILHVESPTSTIPSYRQTDVPINKENRGRDNVENKKSERNPKETTDSCYFAPLCVATMARSFAPFLLVLATFIALVLCQLGLRARAATMTRSQGQENFDASSSTTTLTHNYDVFISFHGGDTRNGFTAHLLSAFINKRIHAFRDDVDLPRGGEIVPEILKAIETSRIALVVFSKHYANSPWCLDELVKIKECKLLLNQTVMPIFYHVFASEVQNHEGYFAEANLSGPEDKVKIRMAAMDFVANLAGFPLNPCRCCPEPEFINKIVKCVWEVLHGGSPTSTIPLYRQTDVPM